MINESNMHMKNKTFIIYVFLLFFNSFVNAQIIGKHAKGDINQDGNVNAADIVDLVNIIFEGNGSGSNENEPTTSGSLELNATISKLVGDQSLSVDDFPENIQYGNTISLYATFNSFSGTIQIGKGTTRYGSAYLIIDNTTITMISHYSDDVVRFSEKHNLDMSDHLSVTISQNLDLFQITIQTKSSNYSKIISNYEQFNGTPYIKTNGMDLSDVKLTASNAMLDSQLWAFGDSYFGMSSPNRVMYWLKQWGCVDFLIQGFAGQSSLYAYNDLEKLIKISRPRYIIWCLGMNDDNVSEKSNIEDTSWYKYYKKVSDVCEKNGIVLFLSTIPNVLNSKYKNKGIISDYVRSTNYDYIDVAKAVGSNAQGQWYDYGTDSDYQYSDGVHPTEYGAKAIATQFLCDLSIFRLAKL